MLLGERRDCRGISVRTAVFHDEHHTITDKER